MGAAPSRVGYAHARVPDISVEQQFEVLERAGCSRVFLEEGVRRARPPVLRQAIAALKPGDTLIVAKLSCIGGRAPDLASLLAILANSGILFASELDGLSTQSAQDASDILRITGALAELQFDTHSEAIRRGLDVARSNGRVGGRPRHLDEDKLQLARMAVNEWNWSQSRVARLLNVARSTLRSGLRYGLVPNAVEAARLAERAKKSVELSARPTTPSEAPPLQGDHAKKPVE